MSTVPLRVAPASKRRRSRARSRRLARTGLILFALVVLLLLKTTATWPFSSASQPSPATRSGQAASTPSPQPASQPSPTPTRAGTPTPAHPLGASRPVTVPVISQLPALPNGCEAASLAMLLTSAGIPSDMLTLAREQKTNPAQPVFLPGAQGDLSRIASWGDPNEAYVGNVYGRYGYGIYHGPLFQLAKAKAGARAEDLTGSSFDALLGRVDQGQAVLIWVTTTLRPTTRWVTWQGPNGPVRATFKEHAVVLAGHTGDKLIVNNPLSGRRETVPAAPLIASWKQLGQQALTINP